jgi:hypothetical protein
MRHNAASTRHVASQLVATQRDPQVFISKTLPVRVTLHRWAHSEAVRRADRPADPSNVFTTAVAQAICHPALAKSEMK